MLRKWLSILAVTVVASGLAPEVSPQEPKPRILEGLPDHLARRVESNDKLLAEANILRPGETNKAVINAVKVWTSEFPKIRVCFFAGSAAVRAKIAGIANQWTIGDAYIPLDFGSLSKPRDCKTNEPNHIRISFNHAGYWSLVGKDSFFLAPQDESSMNFEAFDSSPPDESEFRATVLHEFGHALGLQHEHQNPFAKCQNEFNWDLIYKYLSGPPNNWSKATTDHNLRAINTEGLIATAPDKTSIMLYSFSPEFFLQGADATCYSPPNTVLSAADKLLIAALYPKALRDRQRFAKQMRDEHNKKLEKVSGQTKSAIAALIDQYLPRPK